MNRLKLQLLSILFLFIVAVGCNDDNSTQPINNENEFVTATIDNLCDTILAKTDLPGMVVGVWVPSKSYTYIKAKGYDDPYLKTPMKLDYKFRIGSNTKSMVITVLLQLVDEGKLSLYDKLSKYFPDFPRANEVTIHQLCNMTSGIYNYTESEVFWTEMLNNPLASRAPEELIAIGASESYYFTPGTSFYYSNTNTILIGRIIEMLTGKSLEENLRIRIYNKYGFTNTSFPNDNKMPNNFIKGWNYLTGEELVDVSEMFSISWGWAAGAAVSDIYDVKKWVELVINGGLISDSLQAKRLTGYQIPNLGINFQYGYGVANFGDNNFWGHNGSVPGYTSVMMHDKATGSTIVIFFNTDETNPDGLFLQIAEVIKLLK